MVYCFLRFYKTYPELKPTTEESDRLGARGLLNIDCQMVGASMWDRHLRERVRWCRACGRFHQVSLVTGWSRRPSECRRLHDEMYDSFPPEYSKSHRNDKNFHWTEKRCETFYFSHAKSEKKCENRPGNSVNIRDRFQHYINWLNWRPNNSNTKTNQGNLRTCWMAGSHTDEYTHPLCASSAVSTTEESKHSDTGRLHQHGTVTTLCNAPKPKQKHISPKISPSYRSI